MSVSQHSNIIAFHLCEQEAVIVTIIYVLLDAIYHLKISYVESNFVPRVEMRHDESCLFSGGSSINSVSICCWFPRGLVRFLVVVQLVSVAGCRPLTTATMLPVLRFRSLSPPQLAAGLRLVIISCLSRDHPPSGPAGITLYRRQPIELDLSPPGRPTTWLITIHAAANPTEPHHQYSCL